MNDLHYKIALSLIKDVGNITAKKLIAYGGGINNIFEYSAHELSNIPGIGKAGAQKILQNRSKALEEAEAEMEFIDKNNIKVKFYLDPDYPEKLFHCEDAPIILYHTGEINIQDRKTLSVVGTRNATRRGKDYCNSIIKELGVNHPEMIIISGLAYGIDAYAHKAAIENNLLTYAVLGHGLHMIYPSSHRELSEKICDQGALISEFHSTAKNDPSNFVRRNRIVAGMSSAVLVVESGEKGGSLITADLANSYNRDVFAIPGRPGDIYSKGCNALIKANKAALIENYDDLEFFLGWKTKSKKRKDTQKSMFIELSDIENDILGVIKQEECISLDMICIKLDHPVSKISPVLLELEFKNLIRSLPGSSYSML